MTLKLVEYEDARGYADAVMDRLMEAEAKNCAFVATVQANPTGNANYQNTGSRPVGDSERWELGV